MATAPAPIDRDAHLLARAEADPAFRQALLTDAKAAIERELGVTFPAGMKVVAVQESGDVHYLLLPALAANRELSDADLDRVSGGIGPQLVPRRKKPILVIDPDGDAERIQTRPARMSDLLHHIRTPGFTEHDRQPSSRQGRQRPRSSGCTPCRRITLPARCHGRASFLYGLAAPCASWPAGHGPHFIGLVGP